MNDPSYQVLQTLSGTDSSYFSMMKRTIIRDDLSAVHRCKQWSALGRQARARTKSLLRALRQGKPGLALRGLLVRQPFALDVIGISSRGCRGTFA